MKKNFFLALLLVLSGFAFFHTPSQAASIKPTITADKQYFDAARGLYFLKGNVYVATKNRIITADEATADPLGLQVWAEGNVTLKQDDLVFTGDKLHVLVNQSRAEVVGNLHFASENLAISSNSGEFNWKTKIATFQDNVVVKTQTEQREYQNLKYDVISQEIVEAN